MLPVTEHFVLVWLGFVVSREWYFLFLFPLACFGWVFFFCFFFLRANDVAMGDVVCRRVYQSRKLSEAEDVKHL